MARQPREPREYFYIVAWIDQETYDERGEVGVSFTHTPIVVDPPEGEFADNDEEATYTGWAYLVGHNVPIQPPFEGAVFLNDYVVRR